MPFTLTSPVFRPNQPIPTRFTGDGDNLSPPLEWSGAPAGTRSFALVMEDPDAPAGTFRHWGLYHIAGGRDRLPEAVEAGTPTEDLGFCENDFGQLKYDGPAPPPGDAPHRYVFRIAALDTEAFTQAPKLPVEEMWERAKDHVLATAELVGTYGR